MIKRFLLCLAVASICSQGAFAQDLFLSFAEGADARTTTTTTGVAGDTGTAFLFADRGFQIGQIEDLQVGVGADSSVSITEATLLNSEVFGGAFVRWTDDPNVSTDDPRGDLFVNDETGESGVEFFSVNFGTLLPASRNATGLTGSGTAEQDADFDVDADAFLLATIEFVINDGAETVVGFPTGQRTTLDDDGNEILEGFGDVLIGADRANASNSVFQTVTINPGGTGGVVPEPTSAALLALGFAGLFTRRRR